MTSHDEIQDQLSAYIDGELSPDSMRDLDAHLAGCASCAETAAALRATISDLRMLPDPVPSEQTSWAIRGAVRKARSSRGMPLYSRIAVAAGSVAAAVVAFAVLSVGGSTQPAPDSSAMSEAKTHTASFTEADARALVDGSAEHAFTMATEDAVAGEPLQARSADASGGAPPECRASIPRAIAAGWTLVRQHGVVFEGTPAYLYLYRSPDEPPQRALWIFAAGDCREVFHATHPS